MIAAALSIQDPRERPEEQLDQADEAHKRFDVPGSDLLSIVALWDHLRDQQRALSATSSAGCAAPSTSTTCACGSGRTSSASCARSPATSAIRAEQRSRRSPTASTAPCSPGCCRTSGCATATAASCKGARGSTFTIARGSVLARRPPRWVMAAELVETNRLWARRVAAIEPAWAEQLGAHLVRRSYGEPRWDPQRAAAVTAETVTLYGLPIVSGRTVQVDRVDRRLAREMFIRHALVGGEWVAAPRVPRPQRRVPRPGRRAGGAGAAGPAARRRRADRLLRRAAAGRRHVGAALRHVVEGRRATRTLLDLTDDVLGRRIGFRLADYPDTWRQGDLVLPLSYRFDPGGPLDGVSVHVPLTALNRVSDDGFDWQIPGHRARARRHPRAHAAQGRPARADPDGRDRRQGRSRAARARRRGRSSTPSPAPSRRSPGSRVRPAMFDRSVIPAYLRMNVIVTDADGEVVDADDDLGAIKRRLASTAREAIAAAAPIDERRGMVTWDVGTLPQVVSAEQSGIAATGYPALLDDGSTRVAAGADQRRPAAAGDARRRPPAAAAERGADGPRRAQGPDPAGPPGDRRRRGRPRRARRRLCDGGRRHRARCANAAVGRRRLRRRCSATCAGRRPGIAAGAMARAGDVLVEATAVRERLDRLVAPALQPSVDDADRPARPAGAAGVRARGPAPPASTTSPATSGRSATASTASPTTSVATAGGWPRSSRWRTSTRRWSGAGRPAPRSSSSAGAWRSCGSACSPSRSAPRAPSARPSSAASSPPCPDPSEC